MNRPNIVLIMADQWRGDCLSSSGHPLVHTPTLDQLSIQGTQFSRAYSANPSCIPARASLYTGMSARSHGRVGYQDGVEWKYPSTMAGELTKSGYQTQAIGKMHVYPERNQLGFENVILHDGYLPGARKATPGIEYIDDYIPWLRTQIGREADDQDHGVHCNSWVARPWDKPEHTHPTNFVTSHAIDFLKRRNPLKPFFLFMSYHRPHPPFDPPQWAFDQYINSEMPEVPIGDWVDEFRSYWLDSMGEFANDLHPEAFLAKIPEQLLRRARAGYFGHMTHIDLQIKRFLEHLGHEGLEDNTLICFVSDHGELLGDHHLYRKSFPYEGSARIPCIMKGPGIEKSNRCDELIELRDIMPTLLDYAGVTIPNTVEGSSVLSLLEKDNSTEWRREIHGEHTIFDQTVQWIVTKNEKFIWHSGSGYMQLFNLQDDPQERRNLAKEPGHQNDLATWELKLAKIAKGYPELISDGTKLIPSRKVKTIL